MDSQLSDSVQETTRRQRPTWPKTRGERRLLPCFRASSPRYGKLLATPDPPEAINHCRPLRCRRRCLRSASLDNTWGTSCFVALQAPYVEGKGSFVVGRREALLLQNCAASHNISTSPTATMNSTLISTTTTTTTVPFEVSAVS